MQEFNSAELLTMASIDHSDPECIQAFEEFHGRHKEFVWQIAYNKAKNIDRYNVNEVAMVLFQNTFIKIHEKADKFDPPTLDVDVDCRKWITGIMRNVGLQYLEENNKHKDHVVFMEVIPESGKDLHPEEAPTPITYESKLLDKALKTLNDKEKDVLLAYYNFYTDGKVRDVSKEVKEALAKQFNVKVDSLKQIKKRALDKIKDYIDKNKKA